MKSLFTRISLTVLCFTAMLMAVTSCGTSRRAVSGSHASTHRPAPAPKHIDFSTPHVATVNTLLREADTWIGTSYAFGGNDRSGVDCSGFVTQVYSRALDIRLPRTSWQQYEYCTPLTRDQLQEGDLVFFTVRGGSSIGHVGIYIGNDQMIHASSSKGVIISSLSLPYYTTNYYGAGRIDRYYAMVDRDRSLRKVEPVIPPTEDFAVQGPVYAEADKNIQPPVGKPVTTVRIASVAGRQTSPAPAVHPEQVTAQDEPESALAELSEFFD